MVILPAGGFTDPRPDSQIPLGISKGIPIHRRVSRLSQAWEVTVSDVGRAPGAASEDQELGSAAANRELSLNERLSWSVCGPRWSIYALTWPGVLASR